MLYYIYHRLLLVLETLGSSRRQLDKIEKRLGRIENELDGQGVTLEQIRESVIPGAAESLNLSAGPVSEQL
jgi:hypothetical protein